MPTLTEQVENKLVDYVLTPSPRLMTLGDFAEDFGVSRTPVRDALRHLEGIGVLRVLQYQGVEVLFTGADEIAWRARILAATLRAGRPNRDDDEFEDALAASVGGPWAGRTWKLLSRWPACSAQWGYDLRPRTDHIEATAVSFRRHIEAGELEAAAVTIEEWAALTTTH